jgi:predicted flavoprotein YhiN
LGFFKMVYKTVSYNNVTLELVTADSYFIHSESLFVTAYLISGSTVYSIITLVKATTKKPVFLLLLYTHRIQGVYAEHTTE